MKWYVSISIFFLLRCFFSSGCYAGEPYIGLIGGGNAGLDLKKSKAEASIGYYIGGHVGYKFFRHLRIEEEVTYQYSGIHSFEINKVKLSHVKGNVDVWSLMTNVILDLNCPFLVSPYFGGGLGYGQANGHWTGHWKVNRNLFFEEESLPKQKLHKNGFAWQGIVGLNFFVCLGFEASVEYRYFKLENDVVNHRFGAALTKFF